jgi:UDP-glucose:(heptosyl)LPS alpha-1,3-glucosyltransferase
MHAIGQMNDPRVKLLAVGRLNPQESAAAIARHALHDRVKFTGPTPRVADFYAAADVFALPTKYEAWGLVIIEAMACGLPVLTSRLAGAAVAVTPGKSGELLDNPHDVTEIASKLGRLLAGGYDCGDQISRSVGAYRWPSILAQYEQILARCAKATSES